MQLGDFLANAQAQAQAIHATGVRGIATVEAIKSALGQVAGSVLRGVFHRQLKATLNAFERNVNPPIGQVVIHGVDIQVVHQLIEQCFVAAPNNAWFNVTGDFELGVKGQRIADELLQQLAHVHITQLFHNAVGICT